MDNEKKAINSHPYLAVVAVLAAIMMGVLDGTVMNVALPNKTPKVFSKVIRNYL